MFDFKSFIHIHWIVLGTLGVIDINGDFPRTFKRFSSLTGNQVVSTMSDFSTFNHMVRFVLRDDEK